MERSGGAYDKIVDVSVFAGFDDGFFVDIVFVHAKEDVFSDGAAVEHRFLRDQCEMASVVFDIKSRDIFPIDKDAAGGLVVESLNETNDGTFPTAARSYQGDELTWLDF